MGDVAEILCHIYFWQQTKSSLIYFICFVEVLAVDSANGKELVFVLVRLV